MYQLNDRISVAGDLGTVRYVGAVPNWDVSALGVEWDNPDRGKHSGTLKGVHYFSVSTPGSGSFVKENSSRIDAPTTFALAVQERYAGALNDDIEEVSIGSKKWKSYGLEKLNAILKEYQSLPLLMVEKSCIRSSGCVEALEATSLDLSYNLFSEWKEVQSILSSMPRLESLNLNGNRIRDYENANFGSVSSVSLSDTKISVQALAQAKIPHVKSLKLAGNGYKTFFLELQGIESLDLSLNRLEVVPDVSVPNLNVSLNHISSFGTGSNPHVRSLDLRWNPISDFSEIDRLPALFPNLKDLKIEHIPLCQGEDLFLNIVCRVPGLDRLNGSELSKTEVQSCELYFVSKVSNGELKISNLNTWALLLTRLNIKSIQVPKKLGSDLVLTPLDLEVVFGSLNFNREFLPSSTVLRLKGVISTRFKLPFWKIQLYFYLDDNEDLGKQYLENDLLTLENVGLGHNLRVFVELPFVE